MKALCNSANQKGSVFVCERHPAGHLSALPLARPGTVGGASRPCLQVRGFVSGGGGSRVSRFSVEGRRLVAGRPGRLRAGSGFCGELACRRGPGPPTPPNPALSLRMLWSSFSSVAPPRWRLHDRRAVPTVCHCQGAGKVPTAQRGGRGAAPARGAPTCTRPWPSCGR